MQRILLLFIIIFICCSQLCAQTKNSLTGSIIDSISKQPVQYATITFTNARTNKVLNGATTDSLGYFKIDGIDSGLYNIALSSIGLRQKTIQNFHVKQSRITQTIGTIFLRKSDNTLQDVVVTSQAKLIDNKIDKLVYNAENDLTSQGGVATDVLKKIPMVSVDPDGNVELAGSSDIRFLINGKPSTAFGNNIADVLQAIPSSEIKSIEVITNPGAKYDAQGLGGVINIILKSSKISGINGNVSLTAGTRLENGSFNITMRKRNFSLNAFASGMERLASATPTKTDRTTIDTVAKENGTLHQQSEPKTHRYGFESGFGFDWGLNKYNDISGDINYNRYAYGGGGIINQEQQTIPFNSSSVVSDIFSQNDFTHTFFFYSTDANLNYKKTFAKENKSIEVNLSTSLGRNVDKGNNSQTLLPQDSLYYGVNNNNRGIEDETELEIDYTNPFTEKINFDAGADLTFDNTKSTSNVLSLQPLDKIYLYDSSISNYLSYKQQVYALYAEISFPVAKLFDAKIGSRYERTEINTFFSNVTQQVKTPGYNTFVPSAYISKKITDHQILKLSYSRRIERPEYDDLNPFVNTSDPKNISSGNPYLKPEKGYRVELSYNHDYGQAGSFMITTFYRQSNDDIQPYTAFYPSITIADSVYYNASVSTSENIGKEKNTGVSLFVSLKVSDKLNIRTNLFFFRRHIINAIDLGRSPTSFNYRMNINFSYQFQKTFSAEFFGNFSSPRNEIQGKYPSYTTYTFAARKQFFNKKASIAFTATNFANKYMYLPTILYGTNFTTNSYRKVPIRSFGLNFTYKFGKLDFKKDKTDKEEGNDNPVNAGG